MNKDERAYKISQLIEELEGVLEDADYRYFMVIDRHGYKMPPSIHHSNIGVLELIEDSKKEIEFILKNICSIERHIEDTYEKEEN